MKNKMVFFVGMLVLFFIIGTPEKLLADETDLKTGFEVREEEKGGTVEDDESWTTHQEELDFLAELESKFDHVELEKIGEAGNGMPLQLVTIGYSIPETEDEIDEMNYVFMQGGFHGNEPAGRESILKTMRDLASSEDKEVKKMLTESTFIFIPTVNPYGRESNIRRNIDDVDLNRDQIQLKSPEARVIAETQKKYEPILFVDAHERVSGPNMSILGSLNLNVDDEMASLNDELLEDYLFPALEKEGLTSDYYPGSSSPRNIRNLSSLRHSIVLLQETSRKDIPSTRVSSHMVGINKVFDYYKDNKARIVTTISDSKKRNTAIGKDRSKPFYLDGEIGEELPDDQFILNPPPYGYLISKYQYEKLENHLELFNIDVERKENGYYITMAQPMRGLIPFLFDDHLEQRLFSGKAIYDLEKVDDIHFPEHPVKMNESTTFTDGEAGHFPQDWKEIWAPSNWEIQDNPSRLVQYTGSSKERSILTWNVAGEIEEDVEVAGLVHTDGDDAAFTDSGDSLFQIHLHSSGRAEYENTYYLDLNKEDGKNKVSINRLLGKRLTNLESEAVDFEVQLNKWYNAVFKRDGDALKGKVWPYGEAEPKEWQIETTDKYLEFGDVGIGQSTAEVSNNWAFFSVGTGGEAAERAPMDLIDGEITPPNKLKLRAKIAEIESENLEESNLTRDSLSEMQRVIKSAEDMLKVNPTVEEINDKANELDKAFSNLQTTTMEFETFFDEPLEESGWVQTWRDSDWSLKEEPSRLVHDSLETGSGRKLLSYQETGKLYGDVEVSTVVKATEFNNTLFQLHLHSYGEKENSYYMDLRKNGTLRVNRNLNGTFTTLDTGKMPFTVGEDKWYNLILRVEGNVLKGKAWPYGKDEPKDWQVEVENDTHRNGYIGLGQVGNSSVTEFLFASIGSNGQDAPRAPQDIVVDKAPLEDKIVEIENENLEEANLTEASWLEMESVLESAKALLEKEPTNAEVLEKVDELNEVYKQLQTGTFSYETLFDEPLGNSGWQDLWKAGDWSLKDNPPRLVHSTLNTGGGRKLLAYRDAGKIFGDVEVSAVVKATKFNNTLFQLHLQGDGKQGSESSYYLDLRSNNNIRINRNNNGTFTNLKSSSTSYAVEEDIWYNTVLRKDGNMLKAKAWVYGTEEPVEWQVEVEDDLFHKGYLGLGHVQNTAVNEYLFASLSTNGDDAPRAPQDILVDKKNLEMKITEIEDANLVESDYTKASWDRLQAALENAKGVVNSSDINQEDVNQALEKLTAAYNELEKTEQTSKEALQAKVNQIKEEDLDQTQYTEESLEAFQTALKISEELLAIAGNHIEESVYDKALSNLEVAYEELKEK